MSLLKQYQINLQEMYKIGKRIIQNQYHVVDNRTNAFIPYKPVGLVMKKNGQLGLLLDCDKHYSIREIYLSNNQVRLSTHPITDGILVGKDLDINQYNNCCMFDGEHIIKVLYLDNIHITDKDNNEFDLLIDIENSVIGL